MLYDSGSLEPIENGSSTKSESSSGRSYEVDESTSMKYGNLNGTGDSGGENLYRRELVAIVIHKKSRPAGAGTRPMEVCIPTPLEQPPQASQSPRQPQLYTLIKPFAKTIASQSQNGASRSAITIMHERVSR